ncbi:LysR family transcriptional regulator [Metallumcola ferriviriculae]|uniref:LysR family transcriptional regulator n=1 Tax=Metallumcola ferriviriculae TaxID=3039180 RepID=A0AAU0UPL2_9FIRM|nr:LysR family transcriptional regulator [Desulfitibacteraceae bacterium MK1]
MRWQQMVGFYHVAKTGKFTKAAEKTYRTQSALTQQVKKLEEEMGCQLLERVGKKKLLLTPAGRKCFAFVETVLNNYDYLVEEISVLNGQKRGKLKIAAPYTTLNQLLPKVVEQYMVQFPWVELSLLDRPQRAVIELVKSGEVDLGFAIESIIPGNLDKKHWKIIESVLAVPREHPLAKEKTVMLEQIARYPLILPPEGGAYNNRKKLEELFRQNSLNYRVIMESSNVELSAVYVEMGLGISFATVVRDLPLLERKNFVFISLNHYFKPQYLDVITRKDKPIPPYMDAFLSLLHP